MNRTTELLVGIAKDYYLEGLTQSDIAKKYAISRPTVASILKECKKTGIVEIRINDTSPYSSSLGTRLARDFGLRTVCVMRDEENPTATLYKTCLEAARYFSDLLRTKTSIGISWGASVYHMVRQLAPLLHSECAVVQLMGGLGAVALVHDGGEVARILAEKLKCPSFSLLAPLIVQSKALKTTLLSQPGIRETYEKTKSLDIALVGISSDDPTDSALVRAGFLTAAEAWEIFDEGSACDLCGYHFDSNGQLLDIPINTRLVGIEPLYFLRIPRRICIACGVSKARAVLAALRGALITDLFTDESTALRILALAKG